MDNLSKKKRREMVSGEKAGDLERKQENEHNLFIKVSTVLQKGLGAGPSFHVPISFILLFL